MKKIKIVFIINPKSGPYSKPRLVSRISKYLDQGKYKPTFQFTEYQGHARKIASESVKAGITRIVAVGGDGTVNEIGNGIVNSSAIMGIIPTGSGNGFARSLKIPLNIKGAIRVLNNGKIRKIDSATINDRYFFCTCGLGFDARIGKKFEKTKGRGFRNYFKTAIHEYQKYKPRKYKLVIDHQKIVKKAFLITFANSGQYGNNAYISPKARLDDGLIDVCILKPFPHIKAIPLGLSLFSKTIDTSKYLEVIRCKSIKIKKKKKKFQFHLDGEPVKMPNEVEIKIQPKSIKVSTP